MGKRAWRTPTPALAPVRPAKLDRGSKFSGATVSGSITPSSRSSLFVRGERFLAQAPFLRPFRAGRSSGDRVPGVSLRSTPGCIPLAFQAADRGSASRSSLGAGGSAKPVLTPRRQGASLRVTDPRSAPRLCEPQQSRTRHFCQISSAPQIAAAVSPLVYRVCGGANVCRLEACDAVGAGRDACTSQLQRE
jgi:hypothetical protein